MGEMWSIAKSDMEHGDAYLAGSMPAHAVYKASLPIGMPMPFTPWSPRPAIASYGCCGVERRGVTPNRSLIVRVTVAGVMISLWKPVSPRILSPSVKTIVLMSCSG